MSEPASVTVIIPAYNAEISLARAIRSALEQKPQPLEVLVINDGSSDKTAEVAKSFGARIRYLEQSNLGPAAARKAGIVVAKGDYVAFLDADDYWLPEFLFHCVQFMEKNKDVVAVTTGQRIKLWGHPEVIRPALLEKENCPTEPFVIDNFFSFWAKYNHMVTGASLFRRSLIEKAGNQRTEFRVCEDLEYWGYLATYGQWGFIPKVLWVCDPTPAAAKQGWMKKHKKRWQGLPSIADWERRIKPRLKKEDIEGFEIVKARIAASLVHQNILAGNLDKAKSIFMNLEDGQKQNRIMRILSIGSIFGSLGWSSMCKVIQLRELLKAAGIFLTAKLK